MPTTVDAQSQNDPVLLTQDGQTVAIQFQFTADTDVVVLADGDELQLGSHYSVTQTSDGYGSIVFEPESNGGPAIGAEIDAFRLVPYDLLLELPKEFFYQQIQDAFRRNTFQVQQLQREITALGTAIESGDFTHVNLGIPIIPNGSITRYKLNADALGDGSGQAYPGSTGAANAAALANHTSNATIHRTLGTGATNACAGNDARLSDSRTPTAHNHSSNKLDQANTHESADTNASAESLHHTIGTGATNAAAGNHTHTMDSLTNSPFALRGVTRFFTGSGTYAPNSSVRAINVELWGPGGGGGGVNGQVSGVGAGSSGGGGGYCRKLLTRLYLRTFDYVVGPGGEGGAAGTNAGQAGASATSFVATSASEVAITIATPAVLTFGDHGLSAGDVVYLTTDGALPTGLTASTNYYVLSTGLTANSFQLSATPGGEAIATSGSQSGSHAMHQLVMAGSGAGGAGMEASNASNKLIVGAAGGNAIGGDINISGGASGPVSIVMGRIAQLSPPGAAPILGGSQAIAGDLENGTNGVSASIYGCGGTGGVSKVDNATDFAGGDGAGGLISITEYY